MNLADVMDEVAARLQAVDGLRVYAWPPGTVTPPAAVVAFPESYSYDATYGRGSDVMSLPVVVVVGRPTERGTRDRLARYCDGSGTDSVKRVLESGMYVTCGGVRVTAVTFDMVSIGATEYAGALFDLDITGPGRK